MTSRLAHWLREAAAGLQALDCPCALVAHAEPIGVFTDVVVPVARAGHLLVLKLLSEDESAQDRVDINALLTVLADEDVALARAGAILIMERGYHRTRDVAAMLERELAR